MVGPRKNELASRARRRTFLLFGAAAVLAVGCTQSATEPVAESDETNPPSGEVAQVAAAGPLKFSFFVQMTSDVRSDVTLNGCTVPLCTAQIIRRR